MAWDDEGHDDHFMSRSERWRKKRTILIAIGVIALVILIIVGITLGVVLGTRKHEKPPEKPVPPKPDTLTIAHYVGKQTGTARASVLWWKFLAATDPNVDKTVLLNLADTWNTSLSNGTMQISFLPYADVTAKAAGPFGSLKDVQDYLSGAYDSAKLKQITRSPSQTKATKQYQDDAKGGDSTKQSFLLFAPALTEYLYAFFCS
ncbi:hypothetical protein AAVH_15430 [Aphelenchoides avenae]|nr:hypothetical protein AAVH_15430 [Aphelenchus avenae]